jgi:hypothetical protein
MEEGTPPANLAYFARLEYTLVADKTGNAASGALKRCIVRHCANATGSRTVNP